MSFGALEVEVLEASDTKFDFNMTRCRYDEMYKDMGLGRIGHLLSCNRDGTFCEGYDPNISLRRARLSWQARPAALSGTATTITPRGSDRLAQR
jgi:hypothetical protein